MVEKKPPHVKEQEKPNSLKTEWTLSLQIWVQCVNTSLSVEQNILTATGNAQTGVLLSQM